MKWRHEEEEYLKNMYPEYGPKPIVEKFGRKRSSVVKKARHMGIKMNEEDLKIMVTNINREKAFKNIGEKNGSWKGGISKNFYRYKKIQMERYPERIVARREAANAIKKGSIKKEPCCVCGYDRTVAHHEDYSKPLDIIWFCRKHHIEYHKNKDGVWGRKIGRAEASVLK